MKVIAVIVSLLINPLISAAQDWPPASWTSPVEPFQIGGPVYYVGGQELAAYLIDGGDCLILVNVGMAENATMVLDSIGRLGFDPADLDRLLITQAHFDHGGGAEQIRRATGAVVMAGSADAEMLESGGMNDYVFGDDLPFEAVQSVQPVTDLERLDCGALELTTLSTPGHTPGSTSWLLTTNDASGSQTFLFQSSVSVLGDAKMIDNPIYPHIVADFWFTFDRLSSLDVSHVLPDHIVFARPETASASDVPESNWFKGAGQIDRQLERSRVSLRQKLQPASH